jgi:hypothetical protein
MAIAADRVNMLAGVLTRRGAAASLAAVASCLACAEGALAATFDLVDGAVLEGDVVRSGERFLVLSTGLGYQVLSRAELRSVTVSVGPSKDVRGALAGWSAGVYQLRGADGRIWIAREGALLASADGAPVRPMRPVTSEQLQRQGQVATVTLTDEPSVKPSVKISNSEQFAPLIPNTAAASSAFDSTIRSKVHSVIFGDDYPASEARAASALALMTPQEMNGLIAPDARSDAIAFSMSQAYLAGVAPSAAPLVGDQFCADNAFIERPIGPPEAVLDLRSDFGALAVGSDLGVNAGVLAALTQAFFVEAGVSPKLRKLAVTPSRAVPLWIADQGSSPSLFRPERLAAYRGSHYEGAAELHKGMVDAWITHEGTTSEAAIIGFEPVAIISHRNAGISHLSLSALRMLLEGRVESLKQLGSHHESRPMLYLPPRDSREFRHLITTLGVRSIAGDNVKYLADPRDRAVAVAKDKAAIGVVVASAARQARQILIGQSELTAAGPSVASIRNGLYPLSRPIYLALAKRETRHPMAKAFADFLVSPTAAQALRRVNVLPAIECLDESCQVSAAGVADLAKTAPFYRAPPISQLHAPKAALKLAEIEFGPHRSDGAQKIGEFIRYWRASPGAAQSVALRAAQMIDLSVKDDIILSAPSSAARVEAAALALRCAGVPVSAISADFASDAARSTRWKIQIFGLSP